MEPVGVSKYIRAIRKVTRDAEPDCEDFRWACAQLCGLPHAARFYRRAEPSQILTLCDED
eukprot:3093315-Amphidinium_carterae.1